MGNIFPNKFPNKLMIGYFLNKRISKLLPFTEHSIYVKRKSVKIESLRKATNPSCQNVTAIRCYHIIRKAKISCIFKDNILVK